MKNKKITFIIVTWNNEDTIKQCIESIYAYCKSFNIVIIDNNSIDKTINIIEEFNYENIIIIKSQENNGFAKANNIALDLVKTKYICYLNPDTILIEDIVEPSIDMLKKNKSVGIVGCKLLNKNMSLQISTFRFENARQLLIDAVKLGIFFPNFIKEKYFPNFSKCKKSKNVDWVIGAEMILLTDDARRIKGFSTEYYMYTEDMDFCKKMETILNKKTYYLANVKLIHIGGVSESKNTNYNKMKKMLNNKIIFIKKFYSDKEVKKALDYLLISYKLRYLIAKVFILGNNRKKMLEKMKKGYGFVKEMRSNYKCTI